MFGAPTFSFHVDPTVDTKELQLNVDLTVAMPCHCKSTSPLSPPSSQVETEVQVEFPLRIEVEMKGIADVTVLSVCRL